MNLHPDAANVDVEMNELTLAERSALRWSAALSSSAHGLILGGEQHGAPIRPPNAWPISSRTRTASSSRSVLWTGSFGPTTHGWRRATCVRSQRTRQPSCRGDNEPCSSWAPSPPWSFPGWSCRSPAERCVTWLGTSSSTRAQNSWAEPSNDCVLAAIDSTSTCLAKQCSVKARPPGAATARWSRLRVGQGLLGGQPAVNVGV